MTADSNVEKERTVGLRLCDDAGNMRGQRALLSVDHQRHYGLLAELQQRKSLRKCIDASIRIYGRPCDEQLGEGLGGTLITLLKKAIGPRLLLDCKQRLINLPAKCLKHSRTRGIRLPSPLLFSWILLVGGRGMCGSSCQRCRIWLGGR